MPPTRSRRSLCATSPRPVSPVPPTWFWNVPRTSARIIPEWTPLRMRAVRLRLATMTRSVTSAPAPKSSRGPGPRPMNAATAPTVSKPSPFEIPLRPPSLVRPTSCSNAPPTPARIRRVWPRPRILVAPLPSVSAMS